MSRPSHTPKPAQIIEGEYLDPQKLMRLLRVVYGTSDIRVEVERLPQ